MCKIGQDSETNFAHLLRSLVIDKAIRFAASFAALLVLNWEGATPVNARRSCPAVLWKTVQEDDVAKHQFRQRPDTPEGKLSNQWH